MSQIHPLKRVLGKGSAKSGTHHWTWQRITAIALIPLTLWLVWALVSLRGASYDQFSTWLSNPITATLLISWVVAMLYHAQLGLQVVFEDYVHAPALEITLQLLTKFAAFAGIVIAILSIARIALSAGTGDS